MPAQDIARGVVFAAIALAVGAVAFAVLVWRPAGEGAPDAGEVVEARLARLLLAAALAGVAGAAVVLAAGDLPTGRGPVGWWLGLGALALLALLARRSLGSGAAGSFARGTPAALTLGAAAALTLVPGVTGHPAGEEPAAALVVASALHVAAASVWAGGVVCLLLLVQAAVAPPQGARLAAVAERFSAVALVAVVTLALSGVIQGLALVGRIEALATTGYGRLVLIKGALLCALALAGALHRGRTIPALRAAADTPPGGAAADDPRGDAEAGAPSSEAAAAFRRLLVVEAALLIAVFAATAGLAASRPAAAPDLAAEVTATGRLGAAQVSVRAQPGRPGDNRLTIDVAGGAPAQLTIAARQRRLGLGPVALQARRSAPGRYVVTRASLPAPGTWELTLRAPGSAAAKVELRLR